MKLETIRACSIWRALDVVGDVQTLMILEQAFLGTRNFEMFVQKTGISRSIVANRLRKLVDSGCLERITADTGKRQQYVLTRKGRGLFPASLLMMRWQQRWESRDRPYGVVLTHVDCGAETKPSPRCKHCHAVVDARDVDWSAGPGFTYVVADYGRRRLMTDSAKQRLTSETLVDSVVAIFGDRWATLVVRALFTGLRNFDRIQQDAGMASNILSDRLDRLVAMGVVFADPTPSHSERFEYRLTEKGRDLYTIILALFHWGDDWYADEKGPPMLLQHRSCDHALELAVCCENCGDQLTTRNLSFRLAPLS